MFAVTFNIWMNQLFLSTLRPPKVWQQWQQLQKSESFEIWSDKVSLLHIKGTQSKGEHRGESIKTISRRCRRHKERQSRSVRVADSFGKKRFKKSCKPLLCNEVDKNMVLPEFGVIVFNIWLSITFIIYILLYPLCLLILKNTKF